MKRTKGDKESTNEIKAWMIKPDVDKRTIHASIYRPARLEMKDDLINLSFAETAEEIEEEIFSISKRSVSKVSIKRNGITFKQPFITPIGAGLLRGLIVAGAILFISISSNIRGGSNTSIDYGTYFAVAFTVLLLMTFVTLIASLPFLPMSNLDIVVIESSENQNAGLLLNPKYVDKFIEIMKTVTSNIEIS